MKMGFLLMNKNFKTFLISILIVTVAYFIVSVINFFLPSGGIEKYSKEDNTIQIKYQVLSSFVGVANSKNIAKSNTQKELITNIKLKTLFAFGRGNGFVILADMAKKTYILENGQNYKEYKLIKVYANYAIFQKNGKTYQVNIDTKSILTNEMKITKNITTDGNIMVIKHKDISQRTKNMSKLWKEISIDPVSKNNSIVGFKIKNVKSQFFKALGIKKNDIITKINGFDASNNKELLKLYSNISTLKKNKHTDRARRYKN